MTLKLLLDEDSQSRQLVILLTKDGHDVLTVNDAGLASKSDKEIFEFAIKKKRIILTSNCRDFLLLAQEYVNASKRYPGLFLVYKDNKRGKDMSRAEIAKAIANVESAGLSLQSEIITLNHYSQSLLLQRLQFPEIFTRKATPAQFLRLSP
ncbi:MAG: DUF5615 family PIN-like protein [Candidatus Obscuribacterales bacterium]|nr:DUF5615 family PIN-like protein [Candidatus Obscuribacterales bacterium]